MSKKKPQVSSGNNINPAAVLGDTPDSELLARLEEIDIEGNKARQVVSVLTQGSSRSYSGPLPPAEQFKLYEEACPGAGDRILHYMEKEQSSRISADNKALDATILETNKGQILGFIILMCSIIAAVFMALNDKDLLATAFLAPVFLGIVRKFIDGRSS